MTALLFSLLVPVAGAGVALLLSERRAALGLAITGALASLVVIWTGISGAVSQVPTLFTFGQLPPLGPLTLGVDPLSSVIAAAAGGVFLAVSIASPGYLARYLGRYSLRGFSVGFHLLLSATVLVLFARDLVTFFIGWEIMSVLAYLLVAYEHRQVETQSAAMSMLAAGELGTMAALVGMLLLTVAAGGTGFSALAHAALHLPPAVRWSAFLLTFLGFGVKAGLLPGMGWLPRAHPAAPATASALLSGVILNLGIYGILRTDSTFLSPLPLGAGLVVLVVGAFTAILGILYANTENDLKRMLAHSSIENMGLVTVGLGAAFTFFALHQPILAAMAYVAALYHLVNHGFYKSLLFLGAGAVDQSVGLRHMDRLGGLARRMPWTSAFFLAGALSIAALPPFNGFTSEWLLIQSLLRSVELGPTAVKLAFALAGVLVALTAGLAATAFVKAYAMSFLGLGRSEEAGQAKEAPSSLRWGMGLLAAACLLLGITPTYVVSALSRVVASFGPAGAAATLAPNFFGSGLPAAFAATFASIGSHVGKGILPGPGLVLMHRVGPDGTGVAFAMSPSYLLLILAVLGAVTFALVHIFSRDRRVLRRRPWDGGRYHLWPEATYTATGFASPVRQLFQSVFRRTVAHQEVVSNAFRVRIERQPQESYVVDRLVSGPLWRGAQKIANFVARLHHGRLNLYIFYAFIVLLAALLLSHTW